MKTSKHSLFLLLLGAEIFACASARGGYVKESDLRQPPEKYTTTQIERWVTEAAARANPELKVRLLRTSDWANYVNNNHYVPLTVEGLPPGYQFNYSWDPVEGPKAHLPAAEVTETGEYLFWTQKCNFSVMEASDCRALIEAITRHEARHYEQWRRLTRATLKEIYPDRSLPQPKNLSELAKYSGAVVAFFRTWSDGAHYQCREVEAYVDQFQSGEVPAGEVAGRIKALRNYTQGCRDSKWAAGLADLLKRAQVILDSNS